MIAPKVSVLLEIPPMLIMFVISILLFHSRGRNVFGFYIFEFNILGLMKSSLLNFYVDSYQDTVSRKPSMNTLAQTKEKSRRQGLGINYRHLMACIHPIPLAPCTISMMNSLIKYINFPITAMAIVAVRCSRIFIGI